MKKLATVLVVLFTLALAGAALAEGLPAAKAAAAVSNINILNSTNLGWATIMEQEIKANSKSDLFISPSLECGLYTQTKSGKNAAVDTQTASAAIRVRVLLDDVPLAGYPEEGIIFNRRTQTLTTLLGQVLVSDILTDEYVELILDTMDASTFNFVATDVSTGVRNIKLQAKIQTSVTTAASAKATIGFGTVTIEKVRMIKASQADIPVFQ